MALVLIRGSGDVASAVALRLRQAGHRAVLHDNPRPGHSGGAWRSPMRCSTAPAPWRVNARSAPGPWTTWCAWWPAGRRSPCATRISPTWPRPSSRCPGRCTHAQARGTPALAGLAPLTIGLGPGSSPAATSTSRSKPPGRQSRQGHPQRQRPRPFRRAARPRRARPRALRPRTRRGTLRTTLAIGASVHQGDEVARIGDTPLLAPLSGILRGLAHDGAAVSAGAKGRRGGPAGRPGGGVRHRRAPRQDRSRRAGRGQRGAGSP